MYICDDISINYSWIGKALGKVVEKDHVTILGQVNFCYFTKLSIYIPTVSHYMLINVCN